MKAHDSILDMLHLQQPYARISDGSVIGDLMRNATAAEAVPEAATAAAAPEGAKAEAPEEAPKVKIETLEELEREEEEEREKERVIMEAAAARQAQRLSREPAASESEAEL